MKICLKCDKEFEDILIECPICESDLRYRAGETIQAEPVQEPAPKAPEKKAKKGGKK